MKQITGITANFSYQIRRELILNGERIDDGLFDKFMESQKYYFKKDSMNLLIYDDVLNYFAFEVMWVYDKWICVTRQFMSKKDFMQLSLANEIIQAHKNEIAKIQLEMWNFENLHDVVALNQKIYEKIAYYVEIWNGFNEQQIKVVCDNQEKFRIIVKDSTGKKVFIFQRETGSFKFTVEHKDEAGEFIYHWVELVLK